MARLLISPSSNPLQRLIGLIVTAALIVLGLMFSVVLLAVIALVGVIGGGYLWWKTRALRRQMRQMQLQRMDAEQSFGEVFKDEVFEGEIIEGEVVRKMVSMDEKGER